MKTKIKTVRAWALACGGGVQFCCHYTDNGGNRFIYRIYEMRSDAVEAAADGKRLRIVPVEIRPVPKKRKAKARRKS